MKDLISDFQSFLDENTSDLSDSEYLDFLYEVIDECKSRRNAKEEESSDD
jgi:hypothetical protein